MPGAVQPIVVSDEQLSCISLIVVDLFPGFTVIIALFRVILLNW